MNVFLKHILQQLGVYHPLQSRYQAFLRHQKIRAYRKQYEPYRGTGFTCNVCGAVYSRFVPDHPLPDNLEAINKHGVIAGYGEHIICPNCLSTARERLVIACLGKYILPKGKKILLLSPERKLYAYLHLQSTVITADLQPGFYRDIDPNIVQEDATRLTFPDQSFDIVIANHVLEHIPDDRKAMHEFFRVLKPGGKAVLQVPYSLQLKQTLEGLPVHSDADRSACYGQRDHVRIYQLQDYIVRLRQTGFEVEEMAGQSLQAFEHYAIQPGESFLVIRRP